MDVEYTGRQVVVSDKLRKQTAEGVERITTILGKIVSAHAIFTADKYRHIAELTVTTSHQTFVATCEAVEMEAALHDALQTLEQQAVRYKGKKTTIRRHPKENLKSSSEELAGDLTTEL